MSRKVYPPELRERAVRMVAEVRGEHRSEWAAVESVAQKLGIGTAQTLLAWVRKAERDNVGTAGSDDAELKRLRSEVKELRRANEILKAASTFFAAELDRPHR